MSDFRGKQEGFWEDQELLDTRTLEDMRENDEAVADLGYSIPLHIPETTEDDYTKGEEGEYRHAHWFCVACTLISIPPEATKIGVNMVVDLLEPILSSADKDLRGEIDIRVAYGMTSSVGQPENYDSKTIVNDQDSGVDSRLLEFELDVNPNLEATLLQVWCRSWPDVTDSNAIIETSYPERAIQEYLYEFDPSAEGTTPLFNLVLPDSDNPSDRPSAENIDDLTKVTMVIERIGLNNTEEVFAELWPPDNVTSNSQAVSDHYSNSEEVPSAIDAYLVPFSGVRFEAANLTFNRDLGNQIYTVNNSEIQYDETLDATTPKEFMTFFEASLIDRPVLGLLGDEDFSTGDEVGQKYLIPHEMKAEELNVLVCDPYPVGDDPGTIIVCEVELFSFGSGQGVTKTIELDSDQDDGRPRWSTLWGSTGFVEHEIDQFINSSTIEQFTVNIEGGLQQIQGFGPEPISLRLDVRKVTGVPSFEDYLEGAPAYQISSRPAHCWITTRNPVELQAP